MAISMRHNYNFMWIGSSIHNEDMSANFVCQTNYIQMYKGKMFKIGESDRKKKIELFNEKNPLSFRWLSKAKVPGTWRS